MKICNWIVNVKHFLVCICYNRVTTISVSRRETRGSFLYRKTKARHAIYQRVFLIGIYSAPCARARNLSYKYKRGLEGSGYTSLASFTSNKGKQSEQKIVFVVFLFTLLYTSWAQLPSVWRYFILEPLQQPMRFFIFLFSVDGLKRHSVFV